MLGMYIGLRRVSRAGDGGECEQADAEGRPNERGHGGMSSGEVVYSVDNAIEADGVRSIVAVMPPLLVVIHESLGLHQALESQPVLEGRSARVRRVRGWRKGVERRSHVESRPGPSVHDREIDREAKIVAAPTRDVAIP